MLKGRQQPGRQEGDGASAVWRIDTDVQGYSGCYESYLHHKGKWYKMPAEVHDGYAGITMLVRDGDTDDRDKGPAEMLYRLSDDVLYMSYVAKVLLHEEIEHETRYHHKDRVYWSGILDEKVGDLTVAYTVVDCTE